MAKNKKTEERRRKKLFFTIIMILFLGIVLTSSTYAWFTLNSNVSISQLEVNVATAGGLEISANANDWTSKINASNLTSPLGYSTHKNQLPTDPMRPVSTAGDIDSATGFLNMYRGTIDTSDEVYTLASSKEVEGDADKNFVAFDIFFRTNDNGDEKTLYLDKASQIRSVKSIQNASRVAFIVEGFTSYSSSASTAQALKVANNKTTYIWEPNSNKHTTSGKNHALTVYGTDYGITNEALNNGDPIPYWGILSEFDKIALTDKDASRFRKVEDQGEEGYKFFSTKESQLDEEKIELFTLQPGITKVRVYVWFEGQDVDCEDSASGGTVGIDLNFTIDAD